MFKKLYCQALLLFFIFQIIPPVLSAQENFASRYNIAYITMSDGLLHDNVNNIYKDKLGFIWISTHGGGLSRYDGYNFIHFNINSAPTRISSNFVKDIVEDNFHRLWIITEEGTDIISLNTMQSAKIISGSIPLQDILLKPASKILKDSMGNIWLYCASTLYKICFDNDGSISLIATIDNLSSSTGKIALKDIDEDSNIWIGLQNQIYKISTETDSLKLNTVFQQINIPSETAIQVIFQKDKEIWIGTNHGLYRFNRNESILKFYDSHEQNIRSLTQDYITDIAESNQNQLLISTLQGINVYNPVTDDFEQISKKQNGTAISLNSDFVNCIFVDDEIIWLGSDAGGINKLTPRRLPVKNYTYDKNNPFSLPDNPVNAIYEDYQGTLWVGSVEGGLSKKLKNSDKFINYTMTTSTRLSHNTVSSIISDSKNRLWVGTWGWGITLLDQNHPQHKVLKYINPSQCPGFSISFIESLKYDSINNGIWIGAHPGIFFYDLNEEKLINPFDSNITPYVPKALGSAIDSYGNLWIGSVENGLFVIDLHSRKNNKFSYHHLKYRLDAPESLLKERITCIYKSVDGTMWLGSNGSGIYKHSPKENGSLGDFKNFNLNNGLISNNIRGILEDNNGLIWISTNHGLSCFNPINETFICFTENDGLIGNQFYWNAFYKADDGRLYFGGVNGLSIINPILIDFSPGKSLKVIFTRLAVKNEEVFAGSKIISSDISMAEEFHLHEKDNSFSLEFSSLNHEPTHIGNYTYRLLGFEDEWITLPVNQYFVNYTNIPPGKYTFQVIYQLEGKQQDEGQVSELHIIITPFFYKTWWFMTIITICIIGLIAYIYFRRIHFLQKQRTLLSKMVDERTAKLSEQNIKLNKQKEEMLVMSKRIQDLTQDKLSFFTNITHEFRTPITLIMGPIERALKLSENPKVIQQLQFVEKNSKYLLSLINQLMDFRKVESGDIQIMKVNADFISFINSILTPFETFASERNITIKRYYHLKHPFFLFDPDAMQKVVTNLLSNAIKFTPDGGFIHIYAASTCFTPEKLYLGISDTGIGIEEKHIDKIFNRFYQAHNHVNYPGHGQSSTGIGLYLTHRIIKLLGGSISVKKNKGKGSSFRILIPIKRENLTPLVKDNKSIETLSLMQMQNKPDPSKFTILVVEDNRDMRKYISSILEDSYDIVEAENGEIAMTILLSYKIDFIISDLMMPVMDGMELSRNVKRNFNISHIPFLMLTAKTSPETRIESFRTGVDEFIQKPFNEELLLTRIQNIIESRKRYQQKFALNMNAKELQIDEKSRDKKFVDKLMELARLNYKDPEYGPKEFSNDMAISKNILNNKIQQLTGQTTGQFLRNYRLSVAYEIIKKNKNTRNMNISEIAYDVGFNDPKYFTRCFVKHYNITPTKFMENLP